MNTTDNELSPEPEQRLKAAIDHAVKHLPRATNKQILACAIDYDTDAFDQAETLWNA